MVASSMDYSVPRLRTKLGEREKELSKNIDQKYGTPIYGHTSTTACLLKDCSHRILTYDLVVKCVW